MIWKTGVDRRQVVIISAIAALISFVGIGLWDLSFDVYRMPSRGYHFERENPQNANGRPGGYPEITFPPTVTVFLPMALRGRITYYVSTNGNDSNDGLSRNRAFRTIERALEIVQPGEIISILPGVYHEALTLERMGSLEEPITIRGEQGGAVLDGQGVMTVGLWCENCTNFIFESLELCNYTDVGIGAYLSSDIKMRDLTVHNNGFAVQLVSWEFEGYGIHVDESQRVSVENCDVYQNGPQPRPFGVLGTGINTYGCTDCVIQNNHSHNNIGGGILVEDGANVLVEGNHVNANFLDATEDEWWDGGIWIDGGHSITVTNNTFQENLGPGIQISDEDFQEPYGYVLEDNISTGNYYGIYIWNYGSVGFPPNDVLRMSNNQISGNTVQDIWIVP